MSTFTELHLDERILEALHAEGYRTPTPVQAETIPALMDGRDVLGIAQTGTGKTAAFALPILHHLAAEKPANGRPIRALMLTPTRELAAQIGDRLRVYGRHLPLYSTVIFGGVGQSPQVKALRRGVDVLVATPGRLLDLHEQGHVDLSEVQHFVLDEADRMLDMGFIHDVRKIIAELPAKRQSLFFSATMPDSIIELAGTILTQPKHVEVTPPATTVEKIDQRVCHIAKADKRDLLTDILRDHNEGLALVFTGMKHVANRIAEHLTKKGMPAAAIHGNKSQTARVRALESFRKGKIRVLVATDIAARGIDVKGIDLVINYDLPNEPDSYVHRIGRTARAGAEGHAISFCDELSQGLLRQIEKNIRMEIPVDQDHAYHRDPRPGDKDESQQQQSRRERGSNQRRGNRGGRNRRNQNGNRSSQSRNPSPDRNRSRRRRQQK